MPRGRALVIAGAWLFLFGLIQGALVPQFANPRMALSAHMTAVQSGMALMIAGALWSFVKWTPMWERTSWWTTLVSMVVLWLGLTLAAATGASEALPIAGAGHAAGPSTELLVTVIVGGSGLAMTLGWGIFAVGLFQSRR